MKTNKNKLPCGLIEIGDFLTFVLMIGGMESFKVNPATTTNSYSYLEVHGFF